VTPHCPTPALTHLTPPRRAVPHPVDPAKTAQASFIVMEYLAGRPLSDIANELKRECPLHQMHGSQQGARRHQHPSLSVSLLAHMQ
jgi:hypothetical protein